MSTLSLLPDYLSSTVLAYRGTHPVKCTEFLADVLTLTEQLPQTGEVLNFCQDRYKFTVALFAAITRGLLTLLPNSTAPKQLATLCAARSDLICCGDQVDSPFDNISYLHVDVDDTSSKYYLENLINIPQIPVEQPTVCVFTSGSTGTPEPHIKTFGCLQSSIQASAERLWKVTNGSCAVLGTVPFYHMYGLESTVLLPLWSGGILCSRVPFFPIEVAATLAELPSPRFLVTTPFYLRQLLDSEIKLPPLAALLSATAPLPQELACQVECHCDAPLIEIYGSTETGQLAIRRPCSQIEWETFTGITLHHEGDVTIAIGGHLESSQKLNDKLELITSSCFRFIDRNANMINIAGKRSSLAFLNHVLTSLPGVHEGVFFMRDSNDVSQEITRLMAFVVAPRLSATDVLTALRSHLDPAFLPRPIVMVDSLPRDGNGKITSAVLQKLLDQYCTHCL